MSVAWKSDKATPESVSFLKNLFCDGHKDCTQQDLANIEKQAKRKRPLSVNSRLVIYQSGGVGRAPSVVNFNGVLWFLIKSVMLLANMQSTTSLASNY